MKSDRPGTGLRKLCLSAAAALLFMGAARASDNPWGDSLLKFNIPHVHGSGVLVDLGNTKTVKNNKFREPAGRCPVVGKVIKLRQPTTDKKVWPNDYLQRAPLKNSPQDTKPLGGGLAMWETDTVNISPLTLAQLKEMAEKQKKKNTPDAIASKKLAEVVDDHGLCAWWAWVTFAKDSASGDNLDLKYRYPFVWDSSKQKLEGAGKYCTDGDAGPKLPWYCFSPEKAADTVSYNSAYVRLDHATACPEKPVRGVHFGTWNGTACARMIPRGRDKVSSPAACARVVFLMSSSDNPTKYTIAPDTNGLQQDSELGVPVMWPVGAFGSDQPISKGEGINYANWYKDGGYCEVYDTVPNCFIQAPGEYSFTSLGSSDPETAEMPPCNAASEGWQISGECECGDTNVPWTCTDGKWVGGDDACECTTNHPAALGIGLGVAIPVAVLAGVLIYRNRKKVTRRGNSEETKGLLEDEKMQNKEFERVQQRQKHKQSDLVQEAEPSFWGENTQDQTNVMVDEGGPSEAFY
ncbi:hypothetical protein Esti_001131 [Eimeria stiedai]